MALGGTGKFFVAVVLHPNFSATVGGYSQSVRMIKDLMKDRMYPLTIEGLDDAMRELVRKHGN